MSKGSHARAWLTAGVSAAALAVAAPALAQTAAPTPTAPAGVPASGGLGSASTAAPTGVSAVPSANGAQTNTASPQAAGSNAVAEIVVTAERRQESIQDVPVAVSAFSADNLKAKRLDGGDSLVLSVPNVNYSRGNFGGYNFAIRGIGTKLVTNTGDPGVSFNENELPISANHLGDADFFDVQRVEVLRGPQGTLFGRTATGGAVNVITNTPTMTPGGSLTAEFGNYDDKKITGFVNVPVNDYFQFRLAGVFLDRDGFGTNSYNGDSVDGRNLDSMRASFRLKFNDRFTADLIFESFNEKDDRNRVGKQLCIKDPGKTNVGGVPVFGTNVGFLSQGCLPGDPYSNQAFGTVNSLGTLGGIETVNTGLLDTDAFANHPLQNHNLHDIESSVDPDYQANENLLYLRLQYQLTDNLTLSSITGYNRNTGYSREDYNRLIATTPFNTTPAATNGIAPAIAASAAFQQGLAAALAPRFGSTAAAAAFLGTPQGQALAAQQAAATYAGLYSQLFPGGNVSDPQVGFSNKFRTYDEGDEVTDENTEEIRISSHFKGPLNFTAGAIIVGQTNFSNYYVEFNPLTAAFQVQDALAGTPNVAPSYIDPLYRPNGDGHNYYDSRYGDQLTSYAGFGEVNYKLTDDLKITGGFRYTVDHKKGNFYPIELGDPGRGFTFAPGFQAHPLDYVEAPTGRFNIEWTPHLSFTNQTLVYGTYSHGYKPGGFNTPCQNVDLSATCPYPTTYQPEYIDSFEVGTKNTALNGSLVLNLTGFYYMYQGYQISSIVNKSSVQQNIDANLYGAELESIYQPIHNLTFNANIGYLHTEIKSAEFTDQANLTQGDPNLTVIKASDGSNCVVNTQGLAALIAVQEGLGGENAPGVTGNSLALLGACSGAYQGTALSGLYNYSASKNVSVDPTDGVGQGVLVNLKGKQLPNSPDVTVSIGAQYVFELPGEWNATIRGDYYWQDDSYSRVYNSEYDKLKGYDVTNATLTFDNARLGVNVQLYVKNAFNAQPYTDSYLTDASSGLFLNVFTLDPRQYGISLTKKF